ncbi:MAG: hypothetical protein MR388_00485 [Tenericutes bacterium]|nr:hypothetical protein [Mycoplasmatota bacterium]
MRITNSTNSEEVKDTMKSTLENMCSVECNSQKSTTGDEIRKIMRLSTSHVEFSEYDFIRLFFANLSIRGIVKINSSKLGYELIEFYRNEKYSDLFDMQVKKQIEGDFVDMSGCIQQAVLGGILSQHSIMNTDERLILLSEEESKKIIDSYDRQITSKMDDMVCEYTDKSISFKFSKLHEACKKNPRIQLTTNGTPFVDVVDSEYVINNFAENGFVENYCLSDEERNEVKRLRLARKSKK